MPGPSLALLILPGVPGTVESIFGKARVERPMAEMRIRKHVATLFNHEVKSLSCAYESPSPVFPTGCELPEVGEVRSALQVASA